MFGQTRKHFDHDHLTLLYKYASAHLLSQRKGEINDPRHRT